MSTTLTIDEIHQELCVLTRRVEAVESQLARNGTADALNGSPIPSCLPFGLASIEGQVREITGELFPGKCEFTSEYDPEWPEDRYVVVNVEATGEIKEIAARSAVWHERIEQISDNLFGLLRLFVAPR